MLNKSWFLVAGSCCFILLLSVGPASASDDKYSLPGDPDNWICYTTGGASDIHGGSVNKSKCGEACGSHSKTYIGYIAALIAVAGFGSNFIPVKKFDTGDGMFFQWVLCIGIWLVGLVVNMIRYQPPFFFPVFFGGVLWTTGNALVVPIIKMIGMTMGLTIWGVTNMLSGWILGMFVLKQHSSCHPLNYGGVAIVLISTVILAFVKSEGKKKPNQIEDTFSSETAPLINSQKSGRSSSINSSSTLGGSLNDKLIQSHLGGTSTDNTRFTFNQKLTNQSSDVQSDDQDYSWVDKLGKWPKRICGFGMSLAIGFLFGSQFLAVEYMRLCDDSTHSCNELDYIFGHFTGILLVSTFWFVVYSLYMRNKPKIYPKVILPALVSGIIWGIAMVGWFIANEHLSLSVSFPIITAGPGFVSSAWGILVYREIKGWRNIVLYFSGFLVSLCGLIMVSLSSCTVHC